MFTVSILDNDTPRLVARIGKLQTHENGVSDWFGELYKTESGRVVFEEFEVTNPDELTAATIIAGTLFNLYAASVTDTTK